MGKTDFASFRKFILMYDLSKTCNKEIAFELSFCYRDLTDSIFRTFSLFLSLIVRQSKVVRWVNEPASELGPSKNHQLRVSCGNDCSQFLGLLEILKDT